MDLQPATRKWIGFTYEWLVRANNSIVVFVSDDPDLILYIRPVNEFTFYGIELVDADGCVYASSYARYDWVGKWTP